MKKLLYLVLLSIGVTGCSVEEQMNMDVQEVNLIDTGERCGDATVHKYMADETELGNVEVTNDATTIYVKITSNTENGLKNAHLAWAETFDGFGATPGTLPVGKMTKGDDNSVTSYTFKVDLTEITTECILIAARAIFPANEGDHWAGDQTAGQAEWRYFQYCIQECVITPPPPVIVCESAYMATSTNLNSYYREKPTNQNWGWYYEYTGGLSGDPVTFPLYAAAGQNDLLKGFKVGDIVVSSDGSIEIINKVEGYNYNNLHVLVADKLPSKRPAPGHFNNYSETLVDGKFFIIVHMEVCWEE